MKRIFKILIATAMSAAIAGTVVFGGCSLSLGKDGKDGQDVSIYEIYEATNAAREEAGLPTLTFLDFITEYLSYTGEELEQVTSLQSAINRSLLSSVSILTTFNVPSSRPYQSDTQETYAGSGVIVDVDKEAGDMYVVTNAHVVYLSYGEGDGYCDDINLYLYGSEYSTGDTEGTAISADIIGVSLTYDIAVLKVEDSELVKNSNALAAEWSMAEAVYAGEKVYAVGNPEGSMLSVTTGIISRESEYITLDMYDTTYNEDDDFTYRVLRTDAAINGGNSGGGLYNIYGQIVAIVNAKSVDESIDNMGYALPASTVRRVVDNMIDRYEETGAETHGVYRAMLGIQVQLTGSSSYLNNETNLVEIIDTVKVASVSSGLAYGNLRAGDIITNIKISSGDTIKEDVDINRYYSVTDVMLAARVGDVITVTVRRSDSDNELSYNMTVTNSAMTLEV